MHVIRMYIVHRHIYTHMCLTCIYAYIRIQLQVWAAHGQQPAQVDIRKSRLANIYMYIYSRRFLATLARRLFLAILARYVYM